MGEISSRTAQKQVKWALNDVIFRGYKCGPLPVTFVTPNFMHIRSAFLQLLNASGYMGGAILITGMQECQTA